MWAFQFAGARIATQQLGAVLVTLVPLAIATLLVLPFAGLNRDLFRAENRRILVDVVLLGTVGVLPAQLCVVLGVERTLASNASVLSLTVPVLTALSASMFLHEQMTAVALVLFRDCDCRRLLDFVARYSRCPACFDPEYLAGNLLVFASCAGSAFNNSYSRRALSHLSPPQVLVWTFMVAGCGTAADRACRGQGGMETARNLALLGMVELDPDRRVQPWVVDAALFFSHPGSGSDEGRVVRLSPAGFGLAILSHLAA